MQRLYNQLKPNERQNLKKLLVNLNCKDNPNDEDSSNFSHLTGIDYSQSKCNKLTKLLAND